MVDVTIRSPSNNFETFRGKEFSNVYIGYNFKNS